MLLYARYLVSAEEFEAKHNWSIEAAANNPAAGGGIYIGGGLSFSKYDLEHYATSSIPLDNIQPDVTLLGLTLQAVLLEYEEDKELDRFSDEPLTPSAGHHVDYDVPLVTADVVYDLVSEDYDFRSLYEMKIVVKAPTLEQAKAQLNSITGLPVAVDIHDLTENELDECE